MDWKPLLAYITGSVDQELLPRNEYLVTENRILRQQITGRVRLSDGERKTLAELGKQALNEVASLVTPDTILAWHCQLIAKKYDGSEHRHAPGRPTISAELEALVVRLAQENRSWGYDRIAGALAHLGYIVSDRTVGNILKRHGIVPAPERKRTTTWQEFIRTHLDVLIVTDFFTPEVWTWCGLVTYNVLFFILRAGNRYRARTWLKWSVVVWTDPLVLCGQIADRGPRGDHVEFRRSVAQTLARLPFTLLLADGGYDSEANHRWWREDLGIESIIPPVTGRPSRGMTTRPYRRQGQLAFPRKVYGQRWKVETPISVVKRRFGGAVTARHYWQQVRQTLLRDIAYNLYRAVQLGLSVHRVSHRLFKAAA